MGIIFRIPYIIVSFETNANMALEYNRIDISEG